MRIAAIDVGTNSVHLLVADVLPDGEIRVVEKAREQVELGSGGFGAQRITPEAFVRGLETLVGFREAADGLGVDVIYAAATSAVREASNGSDFVKAVRARTGIHVRTISGVEEGRLIYLGARADLDFGRGRVLIVDIGGGSVELVLCSPGGVDGSLSLPLGHIRLTDAFRTGNTLQKDEVKRMRAHVREHLAPVDELVEGGFATLVGTSGAVRTLARMATLRRGEALPEHAHGLLLRRGELEDLLRAFTGLDEAKLADLPGMDARRRRTLPAAAILLREVMDRVGASVLQTNERSLRDGLIADWILKHAPEIQLSGTVASPRLRSVLRVMARFGVDEPHARRVATLAGRLFDALAPDLRLDRDDRQMLEYASLLHDVGHHVAGQDHDKHGAYLIRHTPLPGFTAPEIAVLANLVRYHRGSPPKRKHEAFRTLPRDDRHRVRALSALLRVADALDRSHAQPVDGVTVDVEADRVRIVAHATEPAHVERWTVRRRVGPLAELLGRTVEVEFEVAHRARRDEE